MKQKIARKVSEYPGIHFRKLQRNLDCSSTTIEYHMENLDLRERNLHGYRRFYPSETPKSMEKALAALNHKIRGPMLYYIGEGYSATELADELDVSRPTVSSHLKILDQDQLILFERKGRSKKISLKDNSRTAVSKYANRFIDHVSDGFIDMWE